jgi:hypothetical protein
MATRILCARLADLRICLRVIRQWRDLQVGQTVLLGRTEQPGSEPILYVVPERRMPDGSMMRLGFDGWHPVPPGPEVSSPRGVITKVGLGTFTYQAADSTLRCSVWPAVRNCLWRRRQIPSIQGSGR